MLDKNTESTKMTKEDLIGKMLETLEEKGLEEVTEDMIVSVPFISLYDDDVYTYREINADGTVTDEGWLGLNTSKPIKELITNKTQDATSNN